MLTAEPEICQKKKKKYVEKRGMRNVDCRTWNMARKLKNVQNRKQTLYDLEYG